MLTQDDQKKTEPNDMTKDKQPTMGDGKICYIEIPAIDINASAGFYREVLSESRLIGPSIIISMPDE
jgi:Ser-tRNA(Ala) deacylase AlaX